MTTTTVHFRHIRLDKGSDPVANQILEKVNDLKVMLGLWTLLFILTLVFSDLDMRSLISAFFAWAGGIVSARLDSKLRENRKKNDHDRY